MRSINIGFTGSRYGMSLPTKAKTVRVLHDLHEASICTSAPICFHHGDCIGADLIASGIAKYVGYLVHAHPPFNETKRAFSEANDIIHAPKDYIARDKDIVDVSRILVATPHTNNEVLRSGTWATIRYARSLNKEICIIFPDGSETWENSVRSDKRKATRTEFGAPNSHYGTSILS